MPLSLNGCVSLRWQDAERVAVEREQELNAEKIQRQALARSKAEASLCCVLVVVCVTLLFLCIDLYSVAHIGFYD